MGREISPTETLEIPTFEATELEVLPAYKGIERTKTQKNYHKEQKSYGLGRLTRLTYLYPVLQELNEPFHLQPTKRTCPELKRQPLMVPEV